MNVDKPIKRLEKTLARNPRDLNTWLKLVEAQLRAGAVRPALAVVERALAATGEHSGLRQLRETLKSSLEPEAAPWTADLEFLMARVRAEDFAAAASIGEEFTQRWPEQADGWSLLAESRYRLNDCEGAVNAAERAVMLNPTSAYLHTNLGAMLNGAGQLAQAESVLRRALEIDPKFAAAHVNLGRVLRARGELTAAEASYRRALALSPDQAETHYNLGNLHEELGQPEQAEASYRRALAVDSRLVAAANNLGSLLAAQNRLQEARLLLEQSVELQPDLAQAHHNLGNVLRALAQPELALAAYQQATMLDPDLVDAWQAQGLVLAALGRLDEAEQSHREALRLAPERVDLLTTLGVFYGAIDHFECAADFFEQALALGPEDVGLLINLAGALTGIGRDDRAEELYRRAVELDPERLQSHILLAVLLGKIKRYREALAVLDNAGRVDPDAASVCRTRARILLEVGQLDESEVAYQKAVSLDPQSAGLRSETLVAMAFTGHWPAERLREEAEQWELAALSDSERIDAKRREFHHLPRPGRKLRVGLLSAELGQHPVGYFLRPWLRALDRSKFELFIYQSRNREDAATPLFRELSDHWISLAGLSDRLAAERIRQDQIDILIETTGHDVDSRLGVIAYRAAPVQCHYIGYYATTGLSQMDYFIADPVLVPPEHDHHFSEEVWRLPRTRYAYEPLKEAPDPRWWPDPDGQLWVGSFNNLIKVREESLALWAKVLHALPEARLALKDNKGANDLTQRRVLSTLQSFGISGERVAFMRYVPSWTEHMAYYNRLDLALDSVPFNSATTGFDALWMGCPLVTLAGDQLAGRQAASLLTGLQREDWIASTEQDYVRIAVELVRDRAQRRHIRETQRQRMRGSELCDGPGLAQALCDAFEAMFDRWWRAKGAVDSGPKTFG